MWAASTTLRVIARFRRVATTASPSGRCVNIVSTKTALGIFASVDSLTAKTLGASGAKLMASELDAAMLEGGGRGDFSLGETGHFPAVTVDAPVADEQHVTLGDADLTAHLTPGHTRGCTTWT